VGSLKIKVLRVLMLTHLEMTNWNQSTPCSYVDSFRNNKLKSKYSVFLCWLI